MTVHIKGVGFIRKYIKPGELDLPRGTRFSQLASLLCIPVDLTVLFFIEGSIMQDDREISEGDNIILISPLPGG